MYQKLWGLFAVYTSTEGCCSDGPVMKTLMRPMFDTTSGSFGLLFAYFTLLHTVAFTIICSAFLTGMRAGRLVKSGSPVSALYVLKLGNFRHEG
jgi:hypothetical protein